MSEVVMSYRGKASLDVTITVSFTSQFQKAINILTGNTMYQGIEGYFSYTVVYPHFTVTYELPSDSVRRMGNFTVTYELPSHSVRRMGNFVSFYNE